MMMRTRMGGQKRGKAAAFLMVFIAGIFPLGSTAVAQGLIKPGQSSSKVLELRETEITAKLRDVLGAVTLSETEVVGLVERPKPGDAIPWKDPDPLMLEEDQSKFRFLEDVYAPLDKDRHTHRINTELLRSESLITKEAK